MCIEIAKFFNATAHPMVLPVCEGTSSALGVASAALGQMGKAINWLDQQVVVMAGSHVSSSAVNVTRAFIKAAPYTCIPFLLPKSLCFCAYGGFYTYKVLVGQAFGGSFLINISNGIAFSSLIFGAHNVKCGIQQGSVLKTIRGLAEITFSAYALSATLR